MRTVFATLTLLALLVPRPGLAHPPDPDVRVGEALVPGWWVNLETRQRLMRVRYHSAPTPEMVAAARKEAVADLADETLLALEAERRGLAPEEEAVARHLDELVSRFGGETRLAESLEAVGGSQDGLESRARRRAAGAALVRTLEQAAGPVTLEDARAYYDDHPDRWTMPASLQLNAVLVKVDPTRVLDSKHRPETEERARRIAAALRAGRAIALLAKEYPRDTFEALGWVHQGALKAPMNEAAADLEPGAVSEPLATTMGFYLVHLLDRKEGGRLPFEEVSAAVLARMEERRRERLRSEQLVLARNRWPVTDAARPTP